MPIRPRPVGPSGNATGQLAAFGLGVARRAAQATGNYSSTVAAVRAALPGILYANALRIASSGYSQAQRLADLSTRPDAYRIPTHLSQEVSTQIPAWRYVTTATYTDPISGQTTTTRVVIDSDTQLTIGDLRDAVLQETVERDYEYKIRSGRQVQEEVEEVSVDVVAIYCRSC